MSFQLYLAIDQGGQSSRVAVYNGQGEQLHLFSAPCATRHYRPDAASVEFIEQDGDEILQGIRACLEQVADALGDEITHVVGAGFAGQGSSLLCWNKVSGAALSPVLSWQDIRAEALLQALPLTHAQAQVLTGLRVSPHYGASKIAWCLAHNPVVVHARNQAQLMVGPIVSYVFWHLLDSHRPDVDPGHAQRTLLWNVNTGDWDAALLALFDIPSAILPRCAYHNSYFGALRLRGHVIPMRASARDQGASLFAQGMPDKQACYINIGTGAFIQRVSPHLQAPAGLLVSPLWLPEGQPDQACYAWEATVNGAASAIPFIQEHTGLEVTPADIQRALSTGTSGYFLNAIGGLSAPYWRTDVQSRFSEGLGPDEKIAAWLESVMFQINVNVMLMDQLGAAQLIIISGGLSRADALCQALADVTGVLVCRHEHSDATARGIACMAAGIPAGWQSNAQVDRFFPGVNPSLLDRFAVWQTAMQAWLA